MSNNFNLEKTEYMAFGNPMRVLSNFSDFEEFMAWVVEGGSNSLRYKTNQSKYDEFIDDFEQYKRRGGRNDWFGNPDYAKMGNYTLREYQDLQRLNSVLQSFTDNLSPSLFNKIKKKKLQFNDRFGNFSFDRASQGLFILNELYSPSQNRVVDEREVVKKNNDYYLKSDNSAVIQRKEQRDDGSPLYRTSVRSVFAMFPELPQQATSVEIIGVIGHLVDKTADEILWTGISAMVIAELLIQANIPVKITGMRMFTPNRNEKYAIEIPIKNFHETLDKNQVAFALSDPAFFRFFGFLATVRCFSEFNERVPSNFVASITKGHYNLLEPFLEKTRDEGTVPIIFPQVYSKSDCEKYITDTISNLATLFNGATP